MESRKLAGWQEMMVEDWQLLQATFKLTLLKWAPYTTKPWLQPDINFTLNSM